MDAGLLMFVLTIYQFAFAVMSKFWNKYIHDLELMHYNSIEF